MKKYILSILLLFVTFSLASAKGGDVADLVGEYKCEMPGMVVSFKIEKNNNELSFEYCREFSGEECFDGALFGQLVNGAIMGIADGQIIALEHLTIRVTEREGEVWLTVSSDDGLDIPFTLK